jgi:zinc protease
LLDRGFGDVSRKPAPPLRLEQPVIPAGRRILIVDKPERTQTQIAIGTLGSHPAERTHLPLVVGNTSFGGLFSSRLNDEVRSKRGLSYGASSSLTLSRTRDLWSMHTFPAAKDARACIELSLGLFERWARDGVTKRELVQAKSYLVKSHAFELDTAGKRLDQALDIEVLGYPKRYHSHFVDHVRGVTQDDVAHALQNGLALGSQVIVIVATAKELEKELRRIPNVARIDTVAFDQV